MSSSVGSNLSASSFTLMGIPGMEERHLWISLPLCSMYILTILANASVLLIIKADSSLHHPMYLFLSMLLFTDLVQSNAALPKMLLLFWFNHREISFEGCLVQMFFIHSFSIMGSTVLLAMAFDRYVAICHPLRYSTILTHQMVMKLGLVVALRGSLFIMPHPFLVRRLPFCGSHVIQHTYCEHIAVAKLSCADIRVNIVYGLLVAVLVVGLDSMFIAVSYAMIIMAVLRLPSGEARHKVGSTCGAHVCVILIAYIPALFSFISQRFGANTASSTQIILSNLYLIIPPMLNPIIYGIKTKEIRNNVRKWFSPPKNWRCVVGNQDIRITMETLNTTRLQPDYLVLKGIPGLEDVHLLLSIPFCSMYLLSLVGNSVCILVVLCNESLHRPMYICLLMLSSVDILLSSSAVPKTLGIFWFHSHQISFDGCVTQIFFIHSLFGLESSVLLIMAYDRYVAICCPLTYTTSMTNSSIRRMAAILVSRGLCLMIPIIVTLKLLPYQQSNVIEHSYCEHMALARLATADITFNVVYGLFAIFASPVADLVLIAVSYCFIIRVVFKLPSTEARFKAFRTCVCHVCVIVTYYVPAFFSFIAYRFGDKSIPLCVHILLANLYILLPPMMNPIIYGVKTKEIRQKVLNMLCLKRVQH
ncbi:uncharacterized protein LOC128473951 [Spea bombifrons]|uniref:uncharacterized protein LOC128473951 n=1 Tax=Spea bombifrons TaxID=233779 RepID=UPI002348FDF5|nr:uncharacterized protein LOC128473951 [Spea bombifrons]